MQAFTMFIGVAISCIGIASLILIGPAYWATKTRLTCFYASMSVAISSLIGSVVALGHMILH